MQLVQAQIRNFRSRRDVTVDFGAHAAFISGNGTGKSGLPKVLEKSYGPQRILDPDDHYARDIAIPVEIERTLGRSCPRGSSPMA